MAIAEELDPSAIRLELGRSIQLSHATKSGKCKDEDRGVMAPVMLRTT